MTTDAFVVSAGATSKTANRPSDPDRRLALRRGMAGLPALIFLALFFLYPLSVIVVWSFSSKHGLTIEHYSKVVGTPLYRAVMWRTLWMSAAVTLIDVILAYPLAVALSWAKGWKRSLIMIAIIAPFWTNLLVRTYGWIVILHPSGLVNDALMALGVIDEPLELVHSSIGVLIGTSQIMLPYMVLPIFAQIEKLDRRLIAASRSLGAPPLRTFIDVYLPLTLPGVLAGVLIVFVMNLGFFVIPALLGGERDVMVSQLIDFNFTTVLNWEFAAALSAILLCTTVGIFVIAQRWFRLGDLWSEAK